MDDIRQLVLDIRYERDKTNLIKYFSKHQDQLPELINLILQLDEYPYKEYSSWLLVHLLKSKKFELNHYYPEFVDLLFKTDDQTVLRNVTNCISMMPITDYRESELIDLLINFIKDYENKVALQVYSMKLLVQFVKKYPELKVEILEIIDLHAEGKTVAYTVARRHFMEKTKNV